MFSLVEANDPVHLTILRERVSPERLSPYLRHGDGHLAGAFDMYDWNVAMAASLSEDLERLEVVLRNAIHDQLVGWHAARGGRGNWFDQRRMLEPRRNEDVETARRRLLHPETPGRIVAELSFGFWRYLLTSRYEKTLWTPAVRHAFPQLKPQRRRTVHDRVQRLHQLRNRIAHREPVWRRDVAADHANVLTVASYICPHAHAWISRASTVRSVLANRPRGRRASP
ncbi:MAG: hypothetical protein ACRD0P_03015 [Stackebrandtia sp.]